MNLVEKICRKICEEKKMNPDDLACPVMPVFINAAPLINGFIVPPPTAICKVWQLFEHYVEIAFLQINEHLEEHGDMKTIEAIEAVCQK